MLQCVCGVCLVPCVEYFGYNRDDCSSGLILYRSQTCVLKPGEHRSTLHRHILPTATLTQQQRRDSHQLSAATLRQNPRTDAWEEKAYLCLASRKQTNNLQPTCKPALPQFLCYLLVVLLSYSTHSSRGSHVTPVSQVIVSHTCESHMSHIPLIPYLITPLISCVLRVHRVVLLN